jgi:thioredoxin-like negative regulator of GroEL
VAILLVLGWFIAAPLWGPAQTYTADGATAADAETVATLLEAEGPVLVSFTTPACGACRIMAYRLADYATTPTALPALRLDIDDYAAKALSLGVSGFPTQVVVADGQALARHNGLQSVADLRTMADSVAAGPGGVPYTKP